MKLNSTWSAVALLSVFSICAQAQAGFDFRMGNIAYTPSGGTFSVFVDHDGGLQTTFDTIQYDIRVASVAGGVALPINITSAVNAMSPEFLQFSAGSGALTAVGNSLGYLSSDGNGPPGRTLSVVNPSILVANYSYTVGNGVFSPPQAFTLDFGANPFLANAGVGITPRAAIGATFTAVPEPTAGLLLTGLLLGGAMRRARRK